MKTNEFSYYTDPHITGEKPPKMNPAWAIVGVVLIIIIISLA